MSSLSTLEILNYIFSFKYAFEREVLFLFIFFSFELCSSVGI